VTWSSWWVGDALGALVVAPFLLKWIRRPLFPTTRDEIVEWSAIFGVLIALDFLLFWTPFTSFLGVTLIYLILIPFIWGSIRIGPRGITLATLLTAILQIGGAFYRATMGTLPPGSLLPSQIFLGVIAVIFLIFAATSEERKQGARALMRHVENLEDALARLKAEDQAKNNFVAVLAHELRNPLAPLLSSLELMRLKGKDESSRELMNSMRGRVRTMARLLDDLLDISRISHHKLALNKEKVDLKLIVERAVETVEPQIRAAKHHFSVNMPDKSIEFFGDPVRLEQIVVNLLTNAAKYTDPGGKISLALTAHHGQAIIRVKDTGVGISREMLTRLFEPFAQGEPAKRMNKGLGIGLALSKNLVEMHGGTIEVRSDGVGHGSEFTVRFPLGEISVRAKSQERAKQLKFMSPVAESLRIYITDDNEAAADTLGELLEHLGHEVKTAYTGGTALKEIPEFNPHVAILDIGLPDMEGYDLARELIRGGTLATLIALTGYGQDEDKERAREAGFEYHLTKPIGIADLEALLKRIHPKF